jgi:glycosyltransferase involved in cell wall biosynthesis
LKNNTKDGYPRVLIVLMSKVKADDPCNLLIRTQFCDWPKEHLAQIHATGEPDGQGEFCGHYYRLKGCDRYFGGVFQRLRGGVYDMVVMNTVEGQDNGQHKNKIARRTKLIKKRFGDWLIGSGVWEVIFHVRLSTLMAKFVNEFKPDIIYCQGYSLGFAMLPMMIASRFNLPICFQTTDDWPSYTYKSFPMAGLLRRRTHKLVTKATVRMAFGEKMQRLYESRYGESFEVMYHLDDPQRFLVVSAVENEQVSITKQCRIVYTGTLALRRYEALQDLLVVVRLLQNNNQQIKIEVYCSGLPKDIPKELLDAPEIEFLPLPSHNEMPGILASASVLFLPESFTVAPELIEYAISSKAHLYMMSGRPILVYGPVHSGTVEYSAREGWGLVVTERNVSKLKDALVEMIEGGERMLQLRSNAEECIKRHHDLTIGQNRFRKMLTSVVNADEKLEIGNR